MSWKSELLICNPDTGETESVLRSERLIEAPNWTPDGAALVVNGDGLLYRVDLAEPSLEKIDTGFACNLNNDHGVSPDGATLVISDKTEEGASTIYTLPIGGGTPRRVTPNIPSYWHGWSPDGKTLAYTARRGATFQIYTCPTAGGDEVQMTDGFDHCDGPDYTPDGAHIWFNGEVDGKVDLWRIPSAGGQPERMTDDDLTNWFPHPSPNGDRVLYLAYAPGVAEHPRDHHVDLRIMPAAGGPSRKVVSLFGGQGSINVPNWAPDGMRFAFMRYADPENAS